MIKPKKSLGQNFLKNYEIVKKIVSAAEISKDDTILEIGPGTGILTAELIKTGAQVYTIEKDYRLIEKLRKNLEKNKNLKIVHQDALFFDLSTFKSKYKVVANIPYNITSPIIRKFLEGDNKPSEMILMVQKEVAQRITAKPGDSNRGLLTLIVEFFADTEILFEVSRKDFYPMPKVDSAVIKMQVTRDKIQDIEEEFFFKIVKAGFSAKRRQIHNSLSATLRLEKDIVLKILSQAKIEPSLRAEDLTLKQWIDLSKNLKSFVL